MHLSRQLAIGLACGAVALFTVFVLTNVSSGYQLSPAHITSLINDRRKGWIDSVGVARYGGVDIETETTIQLLQRQRDGLSATVRDMSKEYHQYQCVVGINKNITSHGGWCHDASEHFTDESLAKALSELFKGQTVASLGDGYGGYKKLLDSSGKVRQYDSYDGAPFCENKTHGLVKFLDISIPVYGLRLYDWVISLEVGEHIPKQYEHIFLDNIARHADKGIVLSWAVPGQGGHGHVNNQPLEYIVQQLDNRGFYRDLKHSYRLQNASHVDWLKNNTNVYRRKPGQHANVLMI